MSLHHHRVMWRALVDEMETQGDENRGVFLDHYTKLYVDGSAIAVRRLAEENGQRHTISLGRLVTDIRDNAGLLTRQRFVGRLENPNEARAWARRSALDEAAREWEVFCGRGESFDQSLATSDLERLRVASATVAAFADRTIAHIDDRGVRPPATFSDLDHAIETMSDVLGSFAVRVNGSRLAFYEPAIQQDWKSPFRRGMFND